MDISGGAMPKGQKMQMKMTMKPTKVGGGKVTLVSTLKSMMMNGQDMTKMATGGKTTTTTTMDSTGKVLSGDAGSNFAGTTFPTKPVAVGATWSSKFAMGPQNFTATCKLVDVKNFNGVPAAHIQVTMGGKLPLKLDKPIDVWIERSSGMLMQMNMKGKVSTPARGSVPAQTTSTTMVMKRV